jgi:hypothetical protein
VEDPEQLQTWLDEFMEVDCQSEVFEVGRQFRLQALTGSACLFGARALRHSVCATGTRGVLCWPFRGAGKTKGGGEGWGNSCADGAPRGAQQSGCATDSLPLQATPKGVHE